MADTVVKRSNDAEREVEKRVMKYQSEKEERDRLHELKKKDDIRKKHEEIRQLLDKQVLEKKALRQHENYVNDDYMKQWIGLSEKEG